MVEEGEREGGREIKEGRTERGEQKFPYLGAEDQVLN